MPLSCPRLLLRDRPDTESLRRGSLATSPLPPQPPRPDVVIRSTGDGLPCISLGVEMGRGPLGGPPRALPPTSARGRGRSTPRHSGRARVDYRLVAGRG